MTNQQNRRPKGKGSTAGKGGGKQGRKKGGKPKQGRPPKVDANRPFWTNDAGEAELRALTGTIRPAQDPTALVRSLGSPPIGRFADSAQHYYAPVYEKAQRFAIAMATANGVQLLGDEDDDASEPAADGGEGVEA